MMKVGIVGCGFVGATSAYAMVMRGVGREIVLVDKDGARARAEADDITHAVPFAHPLTIRSGQYEDLAGSRAVIIAAGVSQKPGETRLDLLKRNAAVFGEVIPAILKNAPDTVLVVATNPVDIMTSLASQFAEELGLPPGKVLGTGTTLDSARFRTLLGAHLGVDPQHVHGYVVGEHGDSEVLSWSSVHVGAMKLDSFCELRGVRLDEEKKREIDSGVRNAAYSIIAGKGATYYGIGSAAAKIVDVILHDQRSVLTVSRPTPEIGSVCDVSVSLPRLVGGSGVIATFPLALDPGEQAALERSWRLLREALDQLKRAS